MDSYPIFVGYDGSDGSRAAIRWALDEGARRRLPICLIHVVEFPWRLPSLLATTTDAVGADLIAEAESVLDKVAAESAAAGVVDVTYRVLAGPISGTLCEESGRASMVVLGSRGTGGFVGLPIGSVSVAVATHARCPVVVVRDGTHLSSSLPVVVGVDDSAEARLAVGFAFDEAAARGARLVAVRAWEPPTSPWRSDRWPPGLGANEVELAERNLATGVLHSACERHPSVQVSVHTTCATPAYALEIASREAQLVVVGCRGGGGFHGLLLGSVSLQTLHHAQCPVAVLRQHVDAHDAAGTEPDHDGV